MTAHKLLGLALMLPLTGFSADTRDIEITHPYLLLPVNPEAKREWMQFRVDGEKVRDFNVEFDAENPLFWMPADVSAFVGKTLTIELPTGQQGDLEVLRQADSFPDEASIYREKYRPQFHFTTKMGRLNDPNGLVYQDGEYHLFYQHGPFGIDSTSKHWGHAVSTDLVHWQELPTALHPDELGHIFSGSAVIDEHNTAGFQTGDEPPLVAIYTSAPAVQGHAWSKGQRRSQSLAYSNDRGRTFTKYAGNPVVKNIRGNNRDPKVFWHEESGKWVMILYLAKPAFAILSSDNLKDWTLESELIIPDGHECPELFQLPLDGDPTQPYWIVWEGSGRYSIGTFDGREFSLKSGPFEAVYGANDYAAQNFNHTPDGRTIQLSWMGRGEFKYPGMPFNQQMTVPRELTLRTTEDGPRLYIYPIKELENLRGEHHQWRDITLQQDTQTLQGIAGDLLEVDLTLKPGSATEAGVEIFGQRISYNLREQTLVAFGREAPLPLMPDGLIRLKILVDRTSVEIFANEGYRQMAFCVLPQLSAGIRLFADQGECEFPSVDVWELQPIW
ncbi:GH32 C-terminal domain-containing protein [Ruficoccus amylovorans]|uniref:GH32 C-terminal domain-containing protein n=1 Tax=Ruficoccus amylovorans TaxID=1804625 RepID=A0A842HF51_9BACT|nr:GH32 C-terminal domain-containing protein [Ruficoccus amylovorans]MBC2595235.1 GH32 C-terminal domain-containing protein [Ruficoccus amylovorans]